MIVKITRGSRPGSIATYLHGPGRANEHKIPAFLKHGGRSGGVVIASNIGADKQTQPHWANDMRASIATRPEIKNPVWQASLRLAPNDGMLLPVQWQNIAIDFAEAMGVGEHPWVAVQHGEDHIHIVVSRVSDTGEVWHGRNDRRQAQTARRAIEQEYGLTQAPLRKTQAKTPQRDINQAQRAKEKALDAKRNTPAEVKAQVKSTDLNSRPEVAPRAQQPAPPFAPEPAPPSFVPKEPRERPAAPQRPARSPARKKAPAPSAKVDTTLRGDALRMLREDTKATAEVAKAMREKAERARADARAAIERAKALRIDADRQLQSSANEVHAARIEANNAPFLKRKKAHAHAEALADAHERRYGPGWDQHVVEAQTEAARLAQVAEKAETSAADASEKATLARVRMTYEASRPVPTPKPPRQQDPDEQHRRRIRQASLRRQQQQNRGHGLSR